MNIDINIDLTSNKRKKFHVRTPRFSNDKIVQIYFVGEHPEGIRVTLTREQAVSLADSLTEIEHKFVDETWKRSRIK